MYFQKKTDAREMTNTTSKPCSEKRRCRHITRLAPPAANQKRSGLTYCAAIAMISLLWVSKYWPRDHMYSGVSGRMWSA